MERKEFCHPKRPAGLSKREIVERVDTHLRAHLDAPIRLTDLCRIVGVSERTLRNAFHDFRGVSPKRYALCERLRSVQGALLAATTKQTTVTDVATRFGFYELGRFAGAYKEMFGEAPSETLRGAISNRGEGAANHPEHAPCLLIAATAGP